MTGICGCGARDGSWLNHWGCFRCGAQCCPACGFSPEGGAYCPECAQELFGIFTRGAIHSTRGPLPAWIGMETVSQPSTSVRVAG